MRPQIGYFGGHLGQGRPPARIILGDRTRPGASGQRAAVRRSARRMATPPRTGGTSATGGYATTGNRCRLPVIVS